MSDNTVRPQDPKERDRQAVALDFESFYDSKAGYSLAKMSPQSYCADDRFDAYLVAICGWEITDDAIFAPDWEDGKEVTRNIAGSMYRKLPDGRQLYVGRPESFKDWDNLRGRVLIAHNAAFDSVVTDELAMRGLIPSWLLGAEWKCTADLCAYLMVPRNLKGAMKELYGKEISKAVRTAMDGRHDYELSAEDRGALIEYGGSDAVECHDIWLDFGGQWPELERAISDQKRNATKRGILVDADYARESLKELKRYHADVVCEVPWHPERPVGSLPALRQAVIELGIDPPKSFKKDDPGFLDWQKEHDNIPFIRARQKAVAINMHAARVEGILGSLDSKGLSHPAFLYFGAHTGRDSGKSSTSGVNTNMLNMPRKPVLEGDSHVFNGKGIDIRGMYIPRPGHKFVIADYAQIEARLLLWLVDDTHMMEAMRREGNLYGAAAVQMGWCKPGDPIKKTNPDLYRLSKAATLGLGFGMGAAKFVDSCKAQGLELKALPVEQWPELGRRELFIIRNVARIKGDPYSEQNRAKVGQLLESLRIVTDWRTANSKIVAQWKNYEEVFKRRIAAGKDTVAFRLPSGRVKRYFNPHLCKEETIEIDENGIERPSYRIAIRATTVRGNPPTFLTAGNICENLVQGTAREIMAYAAVELERLHPEWHYMFSVYDEMVFEVPEDEATEAQREMERVMCHGDSIKDWTQGLPLEVESCISDRYIK